ncbi:MAG: hypothetical protein GF421_01190 [Candidatus Aminicenantes bacterium]|nr:hypothetical protein [Candidatus Aminicenantes bacterium]
MTKNKSKPENTEPRVTFYSGYRGEETPRSIVIEGQEWEVKRIIKREMVMNSRSGERMRRFVCETRGCTYLVLVPESGEHCQVRVNDQ